MNSFDGLCFGEVVLKVVVFMKELVLVEDNFGDEYVKDWRGRVVIIVGLIGVGKICLVLVFVGCFGGEIISVDLV